MCERVLDTIILTYWKKFEKYLISSYQTPFGFLIATSLISSLACFFIFKHVFIYPAISGYIEYYFEDLINKSLFYILFSLLIYFLIFLILFQKLKYPVNPKNKIGVFMAVSDRFSDEKTRSFIKQINMETEKILNQAGFGNLFNVVYLDDFKSQRIIRQGKLFFDPLLNKSKWIPNLNKSRWSFLLYGDLKEGKLKGELQYKFEPEYAVTHRQIPKTISNYIGKDFNRVLKAQKWQFPISDTLSALEIISTNIKENILYALGVAAYVSGVVSVANQFHQRLYDLIQPRLDQEKSLRKLDSNLKRLLADENFIFGIVFYERKDLNEAIARLERAVFFKPNFYKAHLNLATLYYLKGDKYSDKVDEHLNLAEKHSEDQSFKLSKGFISIDKKGDYKDGLKLYIDGLKSNTIPERRYNLFRK
jgi:tetratricopeptide (TPR) repeat protein